MAQSNRVLVCRCRLGAAAATVFAFLLSCPPYAAGGEQTTRPRSHAPVRSFVGRASYYAARLKGRRTAIGGRYNPRADTAATSRLPLGTKAHVTNLKNGKAVNVTVTDRGRRVRGRRIDLSKHAATKIGITRREGTAPVKVDPQPGPAMSESSP